MKSQVEQWSRFETSFSGPSDGNPFADTSFAAEFRNDNRAVSVRGFYDGDGCYRLRFMPDEPGPWEFVTRSNRKELDALSGSFDCVSPGSSNHGPVRTANTFGFAYADGTTYVPVGTTCYAWVHQGDSLERQTLTTLSSSPFNKIRFCVFPKHYDFNANDPTFPVFAAHEDGAVDPSRPNVEFFRHLDQRVGELCNLGIEADIILFHPYDRWGYSRMSNAADDGYLRYIVARLAAFRNVWWSLANEFDLMEEKRESDWDRFFRVIQSEDPSGHLRSIHNCRGFYDHGRPWVTHCSIQSSALERTGEWRDSYRKPVVLDECKYEGNIHRHWGNISAQEMTHRFWETYTRGGFAGHGETYLDPDDILWWAKGGVLHGRSPDRIRFFREIVEAAPPDAHRPAELVRDTPAVGAPGAFYLLYLGLQQPAYKEIVLPQEGAYSVEIIDTWEMKIEKLPASYTGRCRIPLPARTNLVLRITRQ